MREEKIYKEQAQEATTLRNRIFLCFPQNMNTKKETSREEARKHEK